MAVSLARPEDVELVPAWLEVAAVLERPVAGDRRRGRASRRRRRWSSGRGCSACRWRSCPRRSPTRRLRSCARRSAAAWIVRPLRETTVVDLSSLWAGPLCGSLLAEAGADVIKVESATRPDGARQGPAAFFDLLNGRKRSVVARPEPSPDGARQLAELLATADVVIEASRPRALEQMGIDAHDVQCDGPAARVGVDHRLRPARAGAGLGRVRRRRRRRRRAGRLGRRRTRVLRRRHRRPDHRARRRGGGGRRARRAAGAGCSTCPSPASPPTSPAPPFRSRPTPSRRRLSRLRGRQQLVVVEVGLAGLLPVLEEAEGPVLGGASGGVLVPAVHRRHAPRHAQVLGVDALVVGVVHVGLGVDGADAVRQQLAQAARSRSGPRTPRSR